MENLDIILKFVENAKETGILDFNLDNLEKKLKIVDLHKIINYETISPYFKNELKNINYASFRGNKTPTSIRDGILNINEDVFYLTNLKYLDLGSYDVITNHKYNELQKLETIIVPDFSYFEKPSIKNHKNIKSVGLFNYPLYHYFIVFDLSIDENGDKTKKEIIDKIPKLQKYFNENESKFTKINTDIIWFIEVTDFIEDAYLYIDVNLNFENICLVVKDSFFMRNHNLKIFKEHITNALYNDLPKNKIHHNQIRVFSQNRLVDFVNYRSYNLAELKNWIADSRILTNNKEPIISLIDQIGGSELIQEIVAEIEQEKKDKIQNFTPISSLHLSNFKLFKDLEISFLNSSINLIIGKNGFGKTSILQAISLLFSKGFANPRFISKDLDSKLSYLEKNAIISFNINQKKILNGDREESNFHLKNNFIVLAYGVNLFSKENHDHKTFAEKVMSGNENPVNVFSLFQDFTDLFYNPNRILDEILYLSETAKDKTEVQQQEWKEIIEVLISTWNEFLKLPEYENYEVEFTGFRHSFKNNKGTWLLDELSEGFRANMLLVSDIFMRIIASRQLLSPDQKQAIKDLFAKTKGIIIIDEFDRHLHPSWQRIFLQTLKRMLPNVQFFVSTHNILAAQSAEGEKAVVLSYEDQVIVSNTLTIQKGLSFDMIFNHIFEGKRQILGTETQLKLNNFQEILNQIYDTNNLDLIDTDFKELAKELSSEEYSQTIQNTINREIKQLKSNFRIPNQKLIGL